MQLPEIADYVLSGLFGIPGSIVNF